MLESIALSMVLWQPPQQRGPEFRPQNPPRVVEERMDSRRQQRNSFWSQPERRERTPQRRRGISLDIFVEMLQKGDPRADLNKDGKINGADLELVLEKKMNRMKGERQGKCGNCCKNK